MSETPANGVSGDTVPQGAAPGLQASQDLKGNVFLTSVDNIYNWGRARSMWPMMFGLACCAIEMIVVASARFDLSRFGMEIMRASPRQADLMIVSGTVTKKMAPNIVRLYNQMAEPKYVLAMGACATSGGPFKEGYNVVSGIDKFLPVDVYVPGCPPTPEALLFGLTKMHEKVFTQSVRTAPWYRKDQLNEPISLPMLGPDLYDVRDYEALRIAAAKAASKRIPTVSSDGEGTAVVTHAAAGEAEERAGRNGEIQAANNGGAR